MGRREGQDNLSSVKSLVSYCLINSLAVSAFPDAELPGDAESFCHEFHDPGSEGLSHVHVYDL